MKRFLFALCVLGLLLTGWACAEIYQYTFPSDLYSTGGIKISVSYSHEDQEWQATLLKAPAGCTSVPSVVSCTADSITYKVGTADSPEYWTDYNVPVTAVVKQIGSEAFKGCTGITDVRFGTELEYIGNYAFSGCPLTEIVVPDNVTSIGGCAFEGSVPVNVTLPFTGSSLDNANYYLFKYIFTGANSPAGDIPETIRTVTITKQTVIMNDAFKDCSQITTIRIPDGTTNIGQRAFAGCTSLTDFVLPSRLERIEADAFEGCAGITGVTFGTELKTIDSAAFSGCPLTEIVVPDNVTTIGSNAFEGSVPVNVTLPFTGQSLNSYYREFKYIFGDIPEMIRTVTITKQTEITYAAFQNCSQITTINFPDETTSIADYAFDGCAALTDFALPSALESIYGYAFRNCPLAFAGEVDLSTVKDRLGYEAFKGCTGITGVRFGTELKSIGNEAFSGCPLTEIVVPDNVTSIGWEAFKGSVPVNVTLPFTGSSLDNANYHLFKYIFTGANSPAGDIPETIRTVTITKQTVIKSDAFKDCSQITTIRIPDGTTNIGQRAFAGCTSLTDFVLPSRLERIEADAFEGCAGITGVTFGTELKTIDSAAFSGCPLTEIVVPDNVTTIGSNAFEGSVPVNVTLPFTGQSLNSYYREFKYIFGDIPETIRTVTITKQTEITYAAFKDCNQITTINYPDGTTSIGSNAFENCAALTDFALPSALESVGSYAFNGCTALESVRYGGSPCMRALIEIGNTNEPLSAAAWEYALTKELLLPQEVQEVEAEALAGNVAQVVLIPEGCAAVAADAFDNCPGLRYIVNLSELELQAPDGVTVLQR